jgi:hypothetical protein
MLAGPFKETAGGRRAGQQDCLLPFDIQMNADLSYLSL